MLYYGLDLVLSGITGSCIFDGNSLLDYKLINRSLNESSFDKKIERGVSLTATLQAFFKRGPGYVVVENPDWHQNIYGKNARRGLAGRERRALQSLAMSRGVAMTALMMTNVPLFPVYISIEQQRKHTVGNRWADKEDLFEHIKGQYNLPLAKTKENMNVTDAIACVLAFKTLLAGHSANPDSAELRRRMNLSKQSLAAFRRGVIKTFGETTLLEERPTQLTAETSAMLATRCKAHDFPKAGEQYLLGIDISSRNPGLVVATDKDQPEIRYHHTPSLKKAMPEDGTESYDILVSGNLILSLGLATALFPPSRIVFEYSDWHRGFQGKNYYIENKAIDHLFYTYGALCAISYFWGIPLQPVGAKQAKKAVLNNANADKTKVKQFIHSRYPMLKNEHERDAALILLASKAMLSKQEDRTSGRSAIV